jgi:hypothetical protein
VIFAHSQVAALHQLLLPFLSLVSVAEVGRNPTVKDEMAAAGPAGVTALMFSYPVHQAADILSVHAAWSRSARTSCRTWSWPGPSPAGSTTATAGLSAGGSGRRERAGQRDHGRDAGRRARPHAHQLLTQAQ